MTDVTSAVRMGVGAAGLRIAAGPVKVAPRQATPAEEAAQAGRLLAQACGLGRAELVAAIAQQALGIPGQSLRVRSLWQSLAEFETTDASVLEDESLWLLRRPDGALLSLIRWRGNGLAGQGDGKQDVVWQREPGLMKLQALAQTPAMRFTLFGVSQGKGVVLGTTDDESAELRVLTQVDCMYSQLRMIDPELTGPLAGLYPTDALVDPQLPAKPFVLLAAARTGSHLLLNLLNSSGKVFVDGEIFNPGKISLFSADLPSERKDGLDMLRISDPIRFAKVILSRSHHVDGRMLTDTQVRGFKLFPEQARNVFDWALDTPEMRIVHLYRANLLAEFSSYLAAHRDCQWIGGPDISGKDRRVLFDGERFVRFVQMKQDYLARLRERLAQRQGGSIEIEYGQINRQNVLQVLSFLLDAPVGVPLDALGMQKQLSPSILDRFINPDEVQRCVQALGHPEWTEPEGTEVGRL